MAYENMTYEVILQRMMKRVAEQYPNIDTREGSILFNALAPAAVELAIMYTELDNARNESFAETASREYLLILCEQMGIDISTFEATKGTFGAIFDAKVPIGSRWNCDQYNYTVLEYRGVVGGLFGDEYSYELQCETPGSAPNELIGMLTPITNSVPNLNLAQITSCTIGGEDEKSDDEIRKLYFDHINNHASDGNVTQYLRWCDEYNGVGKAKVTPLWNGANTVKVSILDASNRAANSELVAEFQEYLDPNSEGMGNGVAPIGSIVTVTTATEVPIDITAKLMSTMGFLKGDVTKAVSEYLAEIAYSQDAVGYFNIASVLLSVEGVDAIVDLTINGGKGDIILGEEEIPRIGNTSWTTVGA